MSSNQHMTNQRINFLLAFLCVISTFFAYSQEYDIGFTSLVLSDSSRIFKPGSSSEELLHYRPLELDIWYPAEINGEEPLFFGDLFGLLEQRAVRYDDTEDFTGLTQELALYYVVEMGAGTDPNTLLQIKTDSHKGAKAVKGEFPLVIYMAGFNGMGFENYKVLENLAQHGYVVVAIWSVGRYPGNMTNQKEDMMEQVYDAEFAVEYLKNNSFFKVGFQKIGLLGCSWGGMSAAVLAGKLPEVGALVSLDGTETHYFGENDTNAYYGDSNGEDNDQFIRSIHQAGLLNTERLNIPYLYFESGDKLDEFTPTDVFHYYNQIQSEKYYLRFEESVHADFTCIPAILKPSSAHSENYNYLSEASRKFLDYTIKDSDEFENYRLELLERENITSQLYEISPEKGEKELMKIQGFVTNKATKEPLQYVNVGVLNQFTGTVTDDNGNFELDIPKDLIGDTLKISMIGFKSDQWIIDVPLSSKDRLDFALEEEISELDEVVLSAKAFKRKTLGNKTKSKFLGTGFSYDQLGAEMGIRVNINRQTLVDQFNFFISYNRLSATSIFRLNFYSIKKGKPDTNIMPRQILIPIESGQTGEISVDLRPYDILLEEDIIIALEWVDNKGENKKDEAIFFSLGMFNSGTLYKHSSQSPFKKYNSFGVGFNLDVRI